MDDLTRQQLALSLRDGHADDAVAILTRLLGEGEDTAEVNGWLADTLLGTNPQSAYEYANRAIAAAHRQYGENVSGSTEVGMALDYDDLLLIAAKAAYGTERDQEVLNLLNQISPERTQSDAVLTVGVAAVNRLGGPAEVEKVLARLNELVREDTTAEYRSALARERARNTMRHVVSEDMERTADSQMIVKPECRERAFARMERCGGYLAQLSDADAASESAALTRDVLKPLSSQLFVWYFGGDGTDAMPNVLATNDGERAAKSLSCLRTLEFLGDTNCYVSIGFIYDHGFPGIDRNVTVAVQYYKKSIDAGYDDARERLAKLYAAGDGVPQDLEKARDLLSSGATPSNAQTNVATSAQGQFDDEVRQAASNLIEEAPDQFVLAHDIRSIQSACASVIRCSELLRTMTDEEKNSDQMRQSREMLSIIMDVLVKLFATGDPQAGFGRVLDGGDVGQSRMAATTLQAIVELDDQIGYAWLMLGRMYESPECCIGVDLARAAQCYQKSIDLDPSMADLARVYLGVLYLQKDGIGRDLRKAIELLTGPALHGDSEALRLLGVAYMYDEPATHNRDKAVIALSAAANMGDRQALAIILEVLPQPLSNPDVAQLGPDPMVVGGDVAHAYPNGTMAQPNAQSQQASGGSESKGGGCYVATAVYGSYDCPEVWVLRRYRDHDLKSHVLGRAFVRAYYAVSPGFVRAFGEQRWFSRLFRARLDRLVDRLRARGYEDTAYEDPK